MPTLVTTPGADNANSYVSYAEWLAYTEARLNTPWSDENEASTALVMATRQIDDLDFVGKPTWAPNGVNTTRTQALAWPRWGVRADGGWVYDEEVIPDLVKRATIELAVRILREGSRDFLADPETDLQGIERFAELKVDTITLKPRVRDMPGGAMPNVVLEILAPVLRSGRGRFRLERG